MLNTPKKQLSFSSTKSEMIIRTVPSKARHESLRKNKQIEYKTILNKLLTISDYSKFIKLASIYVDRQVLICKKQPSTGQQQKNNSKANMFHYQFINDGRFIKRLAQLSQNPLQVCQNFYPFVKKHRDLFKSYYGILDKDGSNNQPKYGEDIKNEARETEEQRQFRLYGFSKRKGDDNDKKDNVVVFSQLIKQNQVWNNSYLQAKKQYQTRRSQIKSINQNTSRQNLKRNDLNQYRKRYNIDPKPKKYKVIFFPGAIDHLTPVEKEIIIKYPRLKYLLIGKEQQHHFIADYGNYKGHKVTLVGAEVQTSFDNEDFFEEDIRHVLKIEIMNQTENKSDKQDNLENIQGDRFVQYMHKSED